MAAPETVSVYTRRSVSPTVRSVSRNRGFTTKLKSRTSVDWHVHAVPLVSGASRSPGHATALRPSALVVVSSRRMVSAVNEICGSPSP